MKLNPWQLLRSSLSTIRPHMPRTDPATVLATWLAAGWLSLCFTASHMAEQPEHRTQWQSHYAGSWRKTPNDKLFVLKQAAHSPARSAAASKFSAACLSATKTNTGTKSFITPLLFIMGSGVNLKLQDIKNIFWKSVTKFLCAHEEAWLRQHYDTSVLDKSSNLRFPT